MGDITDTYAEHQETAHIALRAAYKAGARRIVFGGPTGFGKTRLAAGIIESARPRPHKPFIYTVPRKSLTHQTARDFVDLGLDDISVLQGSSSGYRPSASIQVCCSQTLANYPDLIESASFAIIDESHINFRKAYDRFRCPVIAPTATPTVPGMANHYDTLVSTITTGELVQKGWLSESVAYEPSAIQYDSSELEQTTAFDYSEASVRAHIIEGQRAVHGDVVENWIANGEDRPTICFAYSVAHSKEIAARFVQAGVVARHIDAHTPQDLRKHIFDDVRAGRVKVLTSVRALTIGLDLPMLSCIVFARKFCSVEDFLQAWGRVLRGWEGKDYALVFDHCGNLASLDIHAEDYAPVALVPKKQRDHVSSYKRKGQRPRKKCGGCDVYKPPGHHTCPYCGHTPAPEVEGVIEVKGTLSKTQGRTRKRVTAASEAEIRQFYMEAMGWAVEHGKRPGLAFHATKEKYNFTPPYHWQNTQPVPPSLDVERYMLHRRIKSSIDRRKANANRKQA